MFALDSDRAFELKAKPVQVHDCGLHLRWRTSRRVNVFDPQQQPPARLLRHSLIEQRRIGMPQMQEAIGAGRKAENRLRHGNSLPQTPQEMQCYNSIDELASATAWLTRVEPRFAVVLDRHGVPSLRQGEAGLSGLLMIVTEQFLSLQAASAIWSRVATALGTISARTVLAAAPDELKALGLSHAKVRSFHGIAQAVADGLLDFGRLAELSDADAHQHLTRLPGVGPWTADIYLLANLQRTDAWPAGDLALQRAAQDLFARTTRPSPKEMAELAAPWKPHRAAAARLLWSHYRGLKGLGQAA